MCWGGKADKLNCCCAIMWVRRTQKPTVTTVHLIDRIEQTINVYAAYIFNTFRVCMAVAQVSARKKHRTTRSVQRRNRCHEKNLWSERNCKWSGKAQQQQQQNGQKHTPARRHRLVPSANVTFKQRTHRIVSLSRTGHTVFVAVLIGFGYPFARPR